MVGAAYLKAGYGMYFPDRLPPARAEISVFKPAVVRGLVVHIVDHQLAGYFYLTAGHVLDFPECPVGPELFAIVRCHLDDHCRLVEEMLIVTRKNSAVVASAPQLAQDIGSQRKVCKGNANMEVDQRLITTQLAITRLGPPVNGVLESSYKTN